MGGCASRPKDLDINEPVPVKAPAFEKTDPIAQEINGGEETKTEDPSADLSEPAAETAESSESKPAEEAAQVAEAQTEVKVEAEAEETIEVKTEANPEVQPTAEVSPVEAVVASETEKIPEPVKDEAKPVEAQISEDKSDAPLITV